MNEAKKWLNRANELDKKIQSKSEIVFQLRQQLNKISSFEPPITDGKNKVQEMMQKISDKCLQISADIKTQLDIRFEIIDLIKTIDNDNQQLVLEQRYVLGKSWREIEKFLNYGHTQISKFHSQGLLKIEKLLKVRTRVDKSGAENVLQ